MPAARLLADMSISPATVSSLQQHGWDIVRVSKFMPANVSDHAVLAFARHTGRVLVTQDLDFSTLLAVRGYRSPSVITLRLSSSDPDTITRRLLSILPAIEERLQEGCAVTVDDQAVRIRRLPIT